MDILAKTGLTIDYKRGILYLSPMPAFNDPKRSIITPIVQRDGDDRPHSFITIQGKRLPDRPILLDTGASY